MYSYFVGYDDERSAPSFQKFARQVLCPEKMSVCLVGETRSAGQKLLRKYEQLD